jgi:hypothetical protein
MKSATSFISLASVALAGLYAAAPISATELWDPHLRGVDEGLAAGAAAPPGVYGVLDNYVASFAKFDKNGHKTGVKLDALIEVPVLLWQTGYKVFGADLSMAIAQPFDYTNLRVPGIAGLSDNAHWGTYNTIIVPVQLSWALPEDFHVATAFSIYADDASSAPGNAAAGGGVGSGNGYWTIEPSLGLSWLHDGWNLSMNIRYDYNFKNHKTDYTSGKEIAIDYTMAKTIGKWTVGLGGHAQNQINSDSGAGAIEEGCPANNGCKIRNYGIGPLIGYQFGGLELLAEYNANISTKNQVGGNFVNVRLVTALW